MATGVDGAITSVTLERLEKSACETAPVTFGHPFAPGDVENGLTAVMSGRELPLQLDVKARNDDGSVRHAVVTIEVPCRAAKSGHSVALVPGPPANQNSAGLQLREVLESSYDVDVVLEQEGVEWGSSARQLLQRVVKEGGCGSASMYCRLWLDGPLVTEWVVGVPLVNRQGRAHDHLMAYFAVRVYGQDSVESVRTDVIIENAWAYQDSPENITYRPWITLPDRTPYSTDGPITHYRQARWHRTYWWGKHDQAPLYAALDSTYLQSTPAVPSYENLTIPAAVKARVRQACPLMTPCDQTAAMQTTGSQAAIGPLPQWSAAYVIDTDYRLFNWMTANSDALGGYGIHYRDQATGEPLSVASHPCATLIWPARQQRCPVPPHGDDRFPPCSGDCDSELNADIAHHPSPAYVAYLATGDWYYASELEFWANWTVFWQNPSYRDYADGLVNRTQQRGQAWSLRTLGFAAYLLPDESILKDYFGQVVERNLAWYNEHYARNPDANPLGALATWGSVVYPNEGQQRTGIATWQQSFFTWAIGDLVEKGFDGAQTFLDWTSRFQIGLMTSSDYCWELAAGYQVRLRDTRESAIYDSFGEVYKKSFPELVEAGCDATALNAAIKRKRGEKNFPYPPRTMTGYPNSPTGFPANFQIGLAASVLSNNENAELAWDKFMSRATKPDYAQAPQFAVVPTRVEDSAGSSRD